MIQFDGNDYRKRVLAAIEARGGIQNSDPFEWYDLPLEQAEMLTGAFVAEQIDAVWGFWQKQRDHPKYRGLVTALLAVHHRAVDELTDPYQRRQLASETRSERAERDHNQYAELDGAIERLVERFGGIPRSKLAGLRAFAKGAGIDPASAERRLRRHRWLDDEEEGPAPARAQRAKVSPAVFRQVRDDLDELGRILGTPPPVSLYDLLGLDPGVSRPELAHARDQAAARNRELRPDRRRALVDDLLAAIQNLLLDGDPVAYLDALADEVGERLRPRVGAAVLVEDRFTADDYGHLLGEAQALGLDHARARRVLNALAADLGVEVPAYSGAPSPTRPSGRPAPPAPSPTPSYGGSGNARAAHEAMSQARAALRAGRVLEAQALVARARQLAGGTLPPIRAVGDEIDQVLIEAQQRWRAALQALAARRFTEAEKELERLHKIASDVPGPAAESVSAVLASAQQGSAAASAELAAAQGLAGPTRELALLAAVRSAPDHPGLLAALEAIGVQPAHGVRFSVSGRYVTVSWAPSVSAGTIDYRVEHIDASGARRAFGTSQGLELEAALPPGAGPQSRYAVIARRAGISSAEALSPGTNGASSTPPGPAPASGGRPVYNAPPAAPRPPAPAGVPSRAPSGPVPPVVTTLELLPHGRRIRLVYTPPASGQAEVRRLPDGVNPPPVGHLVDPMACGELVPGMGPGLAIAPKPQDDTGFVVLTVDGPVAVAGGSAWFVTVPPVSGLRHENGRLRWDWPPGCTEVVISWRSDAPPVRAGDPAAINRKLTSTRYELEGGVVLPALPATSSPSAERSLHVAVFAGIRRGTTLITAHEAARLSLG